MQAELRATADSFFGGSLFFRRSRSDKNFLNNDSGEDAMSLKNEM